MDIAGTCSSEVPPHKTTSVDLDFLRKNDKYNNMDGVGKRRNVYSLTIDVL